MKDMDGYPSADNYDRLRRSARDLIDYGVPPPHRGGGLSVGALKLLYERASSPESAADVLKLLHELQTYQVELDLLYEQLQANEHEVGEELAHYRSLYEQAPVAYLIVASDGEIIEGNPAAGVLFGQSPTDLAGKALSALLARGEKVAVNTLLRNAGKKDPVSASFERPDHTRLAIRARPAASGDSVLVILTEATTHAAQP